MFIFILDYASGVVKKKYVTKKQAHNEEFVNWILWHKMGYDEDHCDYMIADTDEIVDMDEEIYNEIE